MAVILARSSYLQRVQEAQKTDRSYSEQLMGMSGARQVAHCAQHACLEKRSNKRELRLA